MNEALTFLMYTVGAGIITAILSWLSILFLVIFMVWANMKELSDMSKKL